MGFATCTIRLTAEEIEQITEWVSMNEPVPPDVGPELFERVVVSNGMSFALRVINGTHHPFLDATLVIGEGDDGLLLCDPGDDPNPRGDYVFEHGNVEFSMFVTEGHRVERSPGDLWLKQDSSGRTIVCEYEGSACVMIRVLDEHDFEIVCWEASEWAEDPEIVMGAIMACAAGKGAS